MMTKKRAKEIILENKDNTAYFDKSVSYEDMYNMFRFQLRFGEGETKVILSSIILAGGKFK